MPCSAQPICQYLANRIRSNHIIPIKRSQFCRFIDGLDMVGDLGHVQISWELHWTVTDLFVTYCTNYHYWGINESLTRRSVSLGERQRIVLAFYPYALYRKLLSCASRPRGLQSASQLEFHFRYSTWKNERICCIIDFLRRQLRGTSCSTRVRHGRSSCLQWNSAKQHCKGKWRYR